MFGTSDPAVLHRYAGNNCFAPAGADGLHAGGRVFLVGGGPSLASVDLSLMHRPGAAVMAVNNAGAYPGVRPHLWTCVDFPSRFHQNIWLDPGCLKLVSMTFAGQDLRAKEGGVFSPAGRRVWQCPGVLFYERNLRFDAGSFLGERTVNWGCSGETTCSEGIPGCRSVMLAAVKLACVLGFREIYLVGADFKMDVERPYAFPQRKDPAIDPKTGKMSDPAASNNRGYAVLAARLAALRPHLEAAGVSVFNATEGSSLDVFPRISYLEAIQRAGEGISPEPDLSGWYE